MMRGSHAITYFSIFKTLPLAAQNQLIHHQNYHGDLVDFHQERQIMALKKEIEGLKLANHDLAWVGLKMWVHMAIFESDLEDLTMTTFLSFSPLESPSVWLVLCRSLDKVPFLPPSFLSLTPLLNSGDTKISEQSNSLTSPLLFPILLLLTPTFSLTVLSFHLFSWLVVSISLTITLLPKPSPSFRSSLLLTQSSSSSSP